MTVISSRGWMEVADYPCQAAMLTNVPRVGEQWSGESWRNSTCRRIDRDDD
jgi:hypothetical protein